MDKYIVAFEYEGEPVSIAFTAPKDANEELVKRLADAAMYADYWCRDDYDNYRISKMVVHSL